MNIQIIWKNLIKHIYLRKEDFSKTFKDQDIGDEDFELVKKFGMNLFVTYWEFIMICIEKKTCFIVRRVT